MNKHQRLVIQILENNKGDNLVRTRNQFRFCTPAQMKEKYLNSKKTRAQILADYEKDEDAINKAVAWVKAQG